MGKISSLFAIIFFLILLSFVSYLILTFSSQLEQVRIEQGREETATFMAKGGTDLILLQKCLGEADEKAKNVLLAEENRYFLNLPRVAIDYFKARNECLRQYRPL